MMFAGTGLSSGAIVPRNYTAESLPPIFVHLPFLALFDLSEVRGALKS